MGFRSTGRRARALAPLVLTLLGSCFSRNNNSLSDAAVPLCNDLSYGTSFVSAMDSGSETEPAPAGGAVTGGSYHLTSTTYYPSVVSGCTVDPVATVLLITSSSPTAGTIETASVTGTGYLATESTSYQSDGTALLTRIGCLVPDPGGVVGSGARISYSATATEIQLYAAGGCGYHIDVYDLD